MGSRQSASPGLLDDASRVWLLARARLAVGCYFARSPLVLPDVAPMGVDQLRGCFVSLHGLSGQLRGCVGSFEADRPLWQHVEDMAVAAATRDTRFTPVGPEELETSVIEISALTPLRDATPAALEVGRHGLWVERGHYRGVLLPQVAAAYGWDRETFLNQTCIKAGMASDAWRDGSVRLCVFEAEVFTESHRLQ